MLCKLAVHHNSRVRHFWEVWRIAACSAAVFLGPQMPLLAKLQKRRGNLLAQSSCYKIKDGGYNNTNINKQLSPTQNTPAMQPRKIGVYRWGLWAQTLFRIGKKKHLFRYSISEQYETLLISFRIHFNLNRRIKREAGVGLERVEGEQKSYGLLRKG